jgi:hypothetical protein
MVILRGEKQRADDLCGGRYRTFSVFAQCALVFTKASTTGERATMRANPSSPGLERRAEREGEEQLHAA